MFALALAFRAAASRVSAFVAFGANLRKFSLLLLLLLLVVTRWQLLKWQTFASIELVVSAGRRKVFREITAVDLTQITLFVVVALSMNAREADLMMVVVVDL
jgi:hypothetical protein